MNISATNKPAVPSPALARWIRKASRQNFGRYSLHTLIFGEGTWAYFLYRTRFQMMNVLVRMGVHVAEYFLIFHTMPSILLAAMAMRVFSTTIESGWWGFLEGMRERIRKLHEKNDIGSITVEIEDWLAVATRLAMMVMIMSCMAVLWLGESPSHDALLLLLGAQLAIRLVLRTLYSGAYAIQRVYIQFQWIIAIDLLVFAIAWMLHPMIGSWALPLCLVVSLLLSTALSYHYTLRALIFMRIEPRQFFKPLSLTKLRQWYNTKSLWLSASSMVSIKLHDVILLVALVLAAEGKSLLSALYLIMPAIRTAMGWSQIMYFDFFKQQLYVFKSFRRTFELVGIIYSLFYALFLFAVSAAVLWSLSLETWWLVVAIYIGCASLLGYVQTALFTRKRHRSLIMLALLQYVLFLGLVVLKYPFEQAAAFSLLSGFVVGVYLLMRSTTPHNEGELRFLPWVNHVTLINQPISAVVLVLKELTQYGIRMQIAKAIQTIWGDKVRFCYHKECFYLANHETSPISQHSLDALLSQSAGYIDKIHKFEAENGKALLLKIRGTLPHQEKKLSTLMDEFKTLFPDGIIQVPQQKNPALAGNLSMEEKRHIIANATAHAEGRKIRNPTPWIITIAQTQGFIEAIFLFNRDTAKKELANEWRKKLNDYN